MITRVNRFDPRLDLAHLVADKQHHYDLIYSVSVIEHLWPWKNQMSLLTDMLKNDGQMIHIINFTDHGMFSPTGNRFTFRKIPSFIYNLIMGPVGRRQLHSAERLYKFFESSKYQVHCKVIRTHSRVLPETEHYSLNSIPPSELGELFQKYNLDSERDLDEILDMCIGSAVFVITKYA